MVSNHVQDLIDRYGTDGSVVPKVLTDYVEARKFYDYNEHSRVGAKHGEFVTDEICDRFCVLGTAEQAIAKLRELESIGVDQFNIYLMTKARRDARGLRARHPAAVQRGCGVETTEEVRRRWDAAAVGWEAERETGPPSTRRSPQRSSRRSHPRRATRPRPRGRHRRRRRGGRGGRRA